MYATTSVVIAGAIIRDHLWSTAKYLGNGVLAWPIDYVVKRSLPAHVIDADELEQTCINEAHTYAIPHIHGC